jgi:hypothetical protein
MSDNHHDPKVKERRPVGRPPAGAKELPDNSPASARRPVAIEI